MMGCIIILSSLFLCYDVIFEEFHLGVTEVGLRCKQVVLVCYFHIRPGVAWGSFTILYMVPTILVHHRLKGFQCHIEWQYHLLCPLFGR